MSELHALRAGAGGRDLRVSDADHEVARVQRSWVRDRGTFELSGTRFDIAPKGFRGQFVLKDGDRILGRADPKGPQGRNLRVTMEQHEYVLKPASVMSRQYVLYDGGHEVGHVWPEGPMKRGAKLELPDELPLHAQVFLAYLVLLAWQQQEQGASGGAH